MPPHWLVLASFLLHIDVTVFATRCVAVDRSHLGVGGSVRRPGASQVHPFPTYIAADPVFSSPCNTPWKSRVTLCRKKFDFPSCRGFGTCVVASKELPDEDTSIESMGVPDSPLKPKRFPFDEGVPLENHPLPPCKCIIVKDVTSIQGRLTMLPARTHRKSHTCRVTTAKLRLQHTFLR